MATSPLDPANVSTHSDRSLGRGHGTRELGPSDSSDTGSDLIGAPESEDELDADSDRAGTGERASAAREDLPADGADIAPDHIEKIVEDEDDDQKRGEPH